MPYKLREDHNANRRLNYQVRVLTNYVDEELERLENKSRADIKCLSCGKISGYSTSRKYRHFTDCRYYALQKPSRPNS